MTIYAYGATDLIGNTTGCLDKLDGSILNHGDVAIVYDSEFLYTTFYILQEDSGKEEIFPWTIKPAINAGTKLWVFTKSYEDPTIGISCAYQAEDKPPAGAVINIMMINKVFIASYHTSLYYAETPSTGTVSIVFKKNNVQFGSVTISSGAEPTVTWDIDDTLIEIGDKVSIVFPETQDATWAGVSITLRGNKCRFWEETTLF